MATKEIHTPDPAPAKKIHRILVGRPFPEEITVTVDKETEETQTQRTKRGMILSLFVIFTGTFISMSFYAFQTSDAKMINDLFDLMRNFFFGLMVWLGVKVSGK